MSVCGLVVSAISCSEKGHYCSINSLTGALDTPAPNQNVSVNFKDLHLVAFDDLQSALEGRSAPVLDPMAEDPVCQRAEAFPADEKTEKK